MKSDILSTFLLFCSMVFLLAMLTVILFTLTSLV